MLTRPDEVAQALLTSTLSQPICDSQAPAPQVKIAAVVVDERPAWVQASGSRIVSVPRAADCQTASLHTREPSGPSGRELRSQGGRSSMSGDLRSGARQWAGRLPLAEAGELTGQQQALAAQLHAFAVPWAERAGFAGTRQEGHLIGPWNAQVHRPGPAAGFKPKLTRAQRGILKALQIDAPPRVYGLIEAYIEMKTKECLKLVGEFGQQPCIWTFATDCACCG